MIVSRELLILLLENHGDWATDPKGFLDLIILLDHLTSGLGAKGIWDIPEVTSSAIELGETFLAAVPLKIEPYLNFRELSGSYVPSDRIKNKFSAILNVVKEDQQMHELAQQTGISPSKETLASEKSMRLIAIAITEKLKSHIQFTD